MTVGADGGQGLHGLGADDIQRTGNREFLFPQGGKRQLLRTIDESTGDWVYTRAGKAYFGKHEFSEWEASIPVKIHTFDGRQRGRVRDDYVPWTRFGANILHSQMGSEATRKIRVISDIKAQLDAEETGDEIFEVSGETYTLDDDSQRDGHQEEW